MQIGSFRPYPQKPQPFFGLREQTPEDFGAGPTEPQHYNALVRRLSSLLEALLNSAPIDQQLLEKTVQSLRSSPDLLVGSLGNALSMAAAGMAVEMEMALQTVKDELNNRPCIEPSLKLGVQTMMLALLLTTRRTEEQAYSQGFSGMLGKMFGGDKR